MENKEKICVFLAAGWISAMTRTDESTRSEIECMREDCAMWNENDKRCGLIRNPDVF